MEPEDDHRDDHRLNFDLSVQFDSPLTHWHATLVPRSKGASIRLEFNNPLELARHLAQLGVYQDFERQHQGDPQ